MQQTMLIPTTTTTNRLLLRGGRLVPHVIKTALGAFLSLFCAASELSCSVAASAASAVKPHRISFNLKCVTLLLLLLSPGLFPRYAAMFVCWGQC